MKTLLVAASLALAAFPAAAGALDIGETFTLRVSGQPLPGFNEPFAPMCKSLDDLKTFTLAKLKYSGTNFCAYFTSGMKLRIVNKDGDYLCVVNAAPKYENGGSPGLCFWMQMSPLAAIGAPL